MMCRWDGKESICDARDPKFKSQPPSACIFLTKISALGTGYFIRYKRLEGHLQSVPMALFLVVGVLILSLLRRALFTASFEGIYISYISATHLESLIDFSLTCGEATSSFYFHHWIWMKPHILAFHNPLRVLTFLLAFIIVIWRN